MVRSCGIIFFIVPCVRVVGVRKRTSLPRVLAGEEPFFFHGGVQVAFKDKSTAFAVQVIFMVSKSDQKRAGYTVTLTCLEKTMETGGGADENFRGPAAAAQCVSPATRGGAIDGHEHVVWLESV